MLKRKITNNPIAKRSQQWICNALIDLMYEKPYNKITITEICKKADLVRETFYRNFSSKDAVVKYSIEQKFESFAQKIRMANEEINMYNVGLAFFIYWKDEKSFLKLLIDNNLVHLILDQFSDQLDSIGDLMVKQKETEQAKKYIISIYAGASTNLLIKWILNDCKESPEEMARIMDMYRPFR